VARSRFHLSSDIFFDAQTEFSDPLLADAGGIPAFGWSGPDDRFCPLLPQAAGASPLAYSPTEVLLRHGYRRALDPAPLLDQPFESLVDVNLSTIVAGAGTLQQSGIAEREDAAAGVPMNGAPSQLRVQE
jgi:hypothetical protein